MTITAVPSALPLIVNNWSVRRQRQPRLLVTPVPEPHARGVSSRAQALCGLGEHPVAAPPSASKLQPGHRGGTPALFAFVIGWWPLLSDGHARR
jgi:hypothetical protein